MTDQQTPDSGGWPKAPGVQWPAPVHPADPSQPPMYPGYGPPPVPPRQPDLVPPAGGGPEQPKRRSWFRRHKILTGILVLVVLFTVIGIATSGGGSGTSGTSTSGSTSGQAAAPAPPPAPSGPRIGQWADDGKFGFKVTSVGHAHSVGDGIATAQGHYVVLNVKVRNIGTESQTLDDGSQYVYDAAGRKYSADGSADIYGNGTDSVFLAQINPGNSITGRLYFDLPQGDHAVKAEFHDSIFSGGVTVRLAR